MQTRFKDKILLFKVRTHKDVEAFGKIYDIYVKKIYRFVYFKVSNVQEAEDLTSEVFLKTWQYLANNGDKVEDLNAFLYKIARNLVIDFYRKRSQDKILVNSDQIKDLQDKRKSLIEKIELGSEMMQIESALRELKDEYREVIILRFIEDLSIGETAKILDKSRGAVRVLVHRALKALREVIDSQNS